MNATSVSAHTCCLIENIDIDLHFLLQVAKLMQVLMMAQVRKTTQVVFFKSTRLRIDTSSQIPQVEDEMSMKHRPTQGNHWHGFNSHVGKRCQFSRLLQPDFCVFEQTAQLL